MTVTVPQTLIQVASAESGQRQSQSGSPTATLAKRPQACLLSRKKGAFAFHLVDAENRPSCGSERGCHQPDGFDSSSSFHLSLLST